MNLWPEIEKAMARKSPVQLVKNHHEVPDSVKTKQMLWPAIAQKKEDGVYCMVIRHAGEVRYYSRTGKQYYTELPSTWATKVPDVDGCWIAELVNPELSLEVLSGLVNPNRVEPWPDAQGTAMLHSAIQFHDYITMEGFIKGVDSTPYSERWNQVCAHVAPHNRVLSEVIHSEKEWEQFTADMIEIGFEGAVLKQASAHWVAGHKGWRVTKAVRGLDVDLLCTGVILGTGKFDGLIAGLKFEWKGKQFTAGLGKGWDLEYQKVQTMAWLHDEFNVVNKIWRVTALQESSKGVLRLPKVGEMRIDKREPDAT